MYRMKLDMGPDSVGYPSITDSRAVRRPLFPRQAGELNPQTAHSDWTGHLSRIVLLVGTSNHSREPQ